MLDFCFLFVFKLITMVQMGAKTTTIIETEMLLKQEMKQWKTEEQVEEKKTCKVEPIPNSRQEIIWTNVVLITILHVLAVKFFFSHLVYLQYKTLIWGKFSTVRFTYLHRLYRLSEKSKRKTNNI